MRLSRCRTVGLYVLVRRLRLSNVAARKGERTKKRAAKLEKERRKTWLIFFGLLLLLGLWHLLYFALAIRGLEKHRGHHHHGKRQSTSAAAK